MDEPIKEEELTKVEVFQDAEGNFWKTQSDYDKMLEGRRTRELEQARLKKAEEIVTIVFPSWRKSTALSYDANVDLAGGNKLRDFLVKLSMEELQQIEKIMIAYRAQPLFGTGIKSQVFK